MAVHLAFLFVRFQPDNVERLIPPILFSLGIKVAYIPQAGRGYAQVMYRQAWEDIWLCMPRVWRPFTLL